MRVLLPLLTVLAFAWGGDTTPCVLLCRWELGECTFRAPDLAFIVKDIEKEMQPVQISGADSSDFSLLDFYSGSVFASRDAKNKSGHVTFSFDRDTRELTGRLQVSSDMVVFYSLTGVENAAESNGAVTKFDCEIEQVENEVGLGGSYENDTIEIGEEDEEIKPANVAWIVGGALIGAVVVSLLIFLSVCISKMKAKKMKEQKLKEAKDAAQQEIEEGFIGGGK